VSGPILETTALCFAYPQSASVLTDLDFEVSRGEKTAIVGRNGAGKTTLLHLLMGLERPQRGQILLHGQPAGYTRKQLLPWRQTVAMVFQDPDDQLFAPTIEQDVSFGPVNLGLDAGQVDERVTAALQAMDIEALRHRAPMQLSGGEKKRAAIAGALAMHPEVLLLDEPTGALDPEAQAQLLTSLEKLHRAGVAVVASTHDLDFAWQWATRIVILDQGKVTAAGDARQLLLDRSLLEAAGLRQPLRAQLAALLQRTDWRVSVADAQELCAQLQQWACAGSDKS